MDRYDEIILGEPTVYGWLETMYGIPSPSWSGAAAPLPMAAPSFEPPLPLFNDGIASWLWSLYGIAYPAAAATEAA